MVVPAAQLIQSIYKIIRKTFDVADDFAKLIIDFCMNMIYNLEKNPQN
jgi:hypothetical protein